jgi:hypothetical protein
LKASACRYRADRAAKCLAAKYLAAKYLITCLIACFIAEATGLERYYFSPKRAGIGWNHADLRVPLRETTESGVVALLLGNASVEHQTHTLPLPAL